MTLSSTWEGEVCDFKSDRQGFEKGSVVGWFSVLKVEDGVALAKWQEGGQLGGCHHRPHKR